MQQQGSLIQAGNNLGLSAGENLVMQASDLKAGNEAYLVAGDNIALLAANDESYSLYEEKSKGSFGSKKFQRDETTEITAVGSTITAGSDISLISGGDQLYQGAKLESGNDLTLASGGEITFEAVKDLKQESHEKSKSNLAWQSAKGKGTTDETLRQSQLVAQGQMAIHAAEGLNIDLKHIDQKTVSQTIDVMVEADPSLAWIKQAEARGDVDWRQVKEIHDSFKYSSSGLGVGAQLVIAILMAAFVGPAAGAALGGAGGAVGAGIASAVASSAATNATVSFVNNRGNLGAVFEDVTASDAMKGYVVAGATAGLTAGLYNDWTGTTTNLDTGKIIGPDLSTPAGIGQFAAKQVLQNGTAAGLSKVLGMEGSLGDALKSTLYNTLAAASFNQVGDLTSGTFADGSPPKVLIHAVVGGLLVEAAGGDFKTGALAAGLNEATVAKLDQLVGGDENLLNMTSQLIGVLAAAALSDADEGSLQDGAWVAQNATQYNYLTDHEMQNLAKDLDGCQAKGTCTQVSQEYFDKHQINEGALANACDSSIEACQAKARDIYEAVERFRSAGYDAELDLSSDERSIFNAFHQFNLEANSSSTVSGAIIMPAAEAIAESLGFDPDSEKGKAFTAGIATGMVGGILGRKPGGKVTAIEFLPKATRNSAGQIETNITQGSAIKTLESSGYKKTISQDGSVTVLTNGEKTYRFYPSSTSTGQPSASLTIEGMKKPAAKIRFSGGL